MTCGLPEVLQTKYFSFPFALQENAAAYFRIYSRRSEMNPLLTSARPGAGASGGAGSRGRLRDNFAAPPLPVPSAAGPAHLRPRGSPPALRPPRSAGSPGAARSPAALRCPAVPCRAYLRRGARGPPGPEPAGRRGRGGRSRAAPRGRGRRRGRRLPRRRWGGPAAAWAAPGSSRAPAPGSEAAR